MCRILRLGSELRAFKTVWQHYTLTGEVLWLLEQFRHMLNDCIRIGLAENKTSLRALSLKAYRQLADYDTPSYYKLCAISKAAGILRNYRKARRRNLRVKAPYVRRLQLVSCYGLKLKDGCLQIPYRPKQPLRTPLNGHTFALLSETDVIIRSFTLTPERLSICYAKHVDELKPHGFVGIDSNLENVTLADSMGRVESYNLAKPAEIKARYREVKANFKRNDVRVRRRISRKYGRKQREKVERMLHEVSKRVVEQANLNRQGIVMERLTSLRRLYRRGNWQGHDYRAGMNGWSYAELQRQIEYKARWLGLPVIYVPPHGSSAKCSICGSRMARIPEEKRLLRCAACGVTVDRDVNAARNILARGLRFGPFASTSEAMVPEPAASAAIRKVDADELPSSAQHAPTS